MHGDLYLKQPVIGTLQDVVITYGTLTRRLYTTPHLSPNPPKDGVRKAEGG